MSLIDPPADKPDRSRAMAFTVAALVLVAIVALWYTFRYYPEKKAAERFFDALVAGNTDSAYQLWKPSSSYTMKDFPRRLGPAGLLRPGEELQNYPCQSTGRLECHFCFDGDKPLLADAGHL